MPRAAPHFALDASPSPVGAVPAVLVVDDERTVRQVVVRALGKHGHEVLESVDAEGALALLGTHGGRIRLVLTDDKMPGMSGRELAAVVARVYPAIRVVLMSGDPDAPGLPNRTLVLPTPFGAAELLAAVDQALR